MENVQGTFGIYTNKLCIDDSFIVKPSLLRNYQRFCDYKTKFLTAIELQLETM